MVDVNHYKYTVADVLCHCGRWNCPFDYFMFTCMPCVSVVDVLNQKGH